MEDKIRNIEQTRSNIVQTEQRIARQKRRVEKMLVERHPADEAQAQLLIMEQSLISMTRFLKILEQELERGDPGLHQPQKPKRFKASGASMETIAVTERAPRPPETPEFAENNS